MQLLATNKSKKKNFSLGSVNNKRFKTNSSDDEKNLEHFKTNSRHRENPLTTHSNASWAPASLCKAHLVNSLLNWERGETTLTKLSYKRQNIFISAKISRYSAIFKFVLSFTSIKFVSVM